jgi:hypothetical protein
MIPVPRALSRARLASIALSGLLFAGLASLAPLPAQAAAPTRCAGVEVPARVTVSDTPLVLNGLGLRRVSTFAFTVKVYVAALYREEPSADPAAILQERRPWRLVLHFVRSVDREQITDAFEKALRREGGEAAIVSGEFTRRLERLKGWIPDLAEGDVLVFTHAPGAGLEVGVGGGVAGTIASDDFARTFLAIWLGSVPPNPELKRGLLGGACG